MKNYYLFFFTFILLQCGKQNKLQKEVIELEWFKTEVTNYHDKEFITKEPLVNFFFRFTNNSKKEITAIDCIKSIDLTNRSKNIFIKRLNYTTGQRFYTLPGENNTVTIFKELLIKDLTIEKLSAIQEGEFIFNPEEYPCNNINNRVPLDELNSLNSFDWKVYNQFRVKKSKDYYFTIR